MTYREAIELQLRQALERLIVEDPEHDAEYLFRVAKLAAELAKEKGERDRRGWLKPGEGA